MTPSALGRAPAAARGRLTHSPLILGCLCLCLLSAAAAAAAGAAGAAGGALGPSDRPEAYFNGSSYLRLPQPLSLKRLVGLSFRTCVGGELFSQRFEGHTLHVTALSQQLVVSWARPGAAPREAALPRETLDNQWHWVALRYRPAPPELLLQLDTEEQVVANVTWNGELLSPSALEAPGAVLLVGNVFSGCLHEGPQLEFRAGAQLRHVLFGPCPLATDSCKDRKDVLRSPPKEHCYNEPCMRHGTCISRHDRYECHCTARYTGNNCEIDAGPACARGPCRRGRCEELPDGDYRCLCPPGYHGEHCELAASLEGACSARPCLNNATCSAECAADGSCAPGRLYACVCAPGFAGADCELDVDECAGARCLHGGRCVDGVAGYTCDCDATGYTGAHCETNVNECLASPGPCGAGTCYDTYGAFVCACQPGYTGERCETMSLCASAPCGAGGACVEEGDAWRCVCARGYLPPLCTPAPAPAPAPAPVPATAPAPACEPRCPPHSHCREARHVQGMPTMMTGVALAKQFTCVCDPGYYGAAGAAPNCSVLSAACAGGVCLHGAHCAQAHDHFNCTCAPGYRGVYCESPAAGAGAAGAGAGAAGAGAGALEAERCGPATCAHADRCIELPSGGARCECAAGWGGARCDQCVEPALCGPCAAAVCRNASCAPDAAAPLGYRCLCPPGYKGRQCEVEVDECALTPKICNNGVCVNTPGSYQCYCRPGWTGDACEQDIDECLSAPCRHGGSCRDLENNYECTCLEGYEGKDCSVDVDECAAGPCAAGATCVDGVARYSCVCPAGLTGARCELDIDDCESSPCLHGGRCADGLASFSCACAGTGYAGARCEQPVDECAPAPCRHGAACLDDVNDYRCVCRAGYTGKNCETDIADCDPNPCLHGGVCLERSNASLYAPAPAPAPADPTAPAPTAPTAPASIDGALPDRYREPFSYENASGFDCVCVAGTRGARCEVDVDECASSPCGRGACVDRVGGYDCECFDGWEGAHCEIDIDECARHQPCAHGRCVDGPAAYTCVCAAGWGGRNCSVALAACAAEPCAHGGTCRAWLRGESEQRFNCTCAPGYAGETCQRVTTMSFERHSYAEVNTSREEGYDISFRFRTTLGDGLLAMGRGLTYFFLELSRGRLNLHSSLLNKWEGVFIGSNLNDSNWQKVFVTINASHVVLAANEEQTIYPISQNEAASGVTSFPGTRLGAPGSAFATLTHGPHLFVGCLQDVLVNQLPVLPEEEEAEGAATAGAGAGAAGAGGVVTRGVRAGCPRRPQCAPSPCRAGGACEDRWTAFRCTCPRPFLGDTCQYNYTAATFGHEAGPARGRVRAEAGEAARRALQRAVDVSMFIRTRKPTGYVFCLTAVDKASGAEQGVLGAALAGGELLLQLRDNRTEQYAVGGTRLDNGHWHLVEVVRNSTLVQVKLNGTEYFRKSISAAKQLDAQVLYLGGPPPAPAAPTAAPADPTAPAGPAPAPTSAPAPAPAADVDVEDGDDADYFKGIIQDVQISNGVNVSVVEMFPLGAAAAAAAAGAAFGRVWRSAGVRPGELSDDACREQPCLHGAVCSVTWNDYVCACPRGYKGKQCAEVEFCQLQACPLNSVCQNLDGGYECLSNATFDGVNTTLTYRLREPRAAPAAPAPLSLDITYRSKYGGTVFHAAAGAAWFAVGVFGPSVAAQWRLDAGLPRLHRAQHALDELAWVTVAFRLAPAAGTITAVFVDSAGHETAGFTADVDVAAWQRVLTAGTLTLGGAPEPAPAPPPTEPSTETTGFEYSSDAAGDGAGDGADDGAWAEAASLGQYFKGCVGGVHVGGRLLPFFSEQQLFVGGAAALLAAQAHYALVAGRALGDAALGCVLCVEADCRRGARCADVRRSYVCACPPGYRGDRCEIDIDECASHACVNGATCVDAVAGYSCRCADGYEGDFCERSVSACASGPCAAGASCAERGGGRWRCECPAGRAGERCERPDPPACEPGACGRGDCLPQPDPATGLNYTCQCPAGWAGAGCAAPACAAGAGAACEHGGTCDARAGCVCAAPHWGARCELSRCPCERGRCAADGSCDCSGTGYTGALCETDVDECAGGGEGGEGGADCGPGQCQNIDGGFICLCAAGYCGLQCALRDPCVAAPCARGSCLQRCGAAPDYLCACEPGWAGRNCSEPALAAAGGLAAHWRVALGAGAALLLLLALGAGAALALGARRTRATRGTYSPSGQEYCNPRAHPALRPPPEERLI